MTDHCKRDDQTAPIIAAAYVYLDPVSVSMTGGTAGADAGNRIVKK